MTTNRTPSINTLTWPLTWAFAHLARVLIKGYQWFVSPVLPGSCRFYPTCSSYALQAVDLHGPLKGGWLALKRIGRCHPWNDGGVDPVPGQPAEHHGHTCCGSGHTHSHPAQHHPAHSHPQGSA